MSLHVALQMDPIENVSISADSTFRLGLEAEARGHSLFQYTPDRLIFDEGRLLARGREQRFLLHIRRGARLGRAIEGAEIGRLHRNPV